MVAEVREMTPFSAVPVGSPFVAHGVTFVKSATSMAKTPAGKTIYFHPVTPVTVSVTSTVSPVPVAA
jgi:hypothetical protein